MAKEKKIKEAVKKRYTAVARGGSCCGDSYACCSPESYLRQIGYSEEELSSLPPGSVETAAGCGNPTGLAEIGPGDVVLDLGSGAGIDAFLAAEKVGPSGRVIGVDMTEAMLEKARQAAAEMGLDNLEFRPGEIEKLPVEDRSVDVIISNCVINLSPDKAAVFKEAFRVLRPGGRMMVSDIVLRGHIPDGIKKSLEAWAGCVAGALDQETYIGKIRAAGFEEIEVVSEAGPMGPLPVFSIGLKAVRPAAART